MLNTTLSQLSCPKRKKNRRCAGDLELSSGSKSKAGTAATNKLQIQATSSVFEVTTGELKCSVCGAKFPILGGVAIVVADVRDYLLSHVKGIAQVVADSEIPGQYRREFLEAKAEIQIEHIEEDLEAERVNALYLMNHYLRVNDLEPSSGKPWWKSEVGSSSALMDKLIREYWDHGPFAQIGKWLAQLHSKSSASGPQSDVLELGCGVGGLYLVLKPYARSYLGVDSSFASIALARHLILGVPGPQGALRIPEDLLAGSVSRPIRFQRSEHPTSVQNSLITNQKADFIVGDLSNLPLRDARYDLALALNAIDMLDEPSELADLKFRLLKENGLTVQSSPYIWHEAVAAKLRKRIPKNIKNSA
ncbi:MAG: class I SAM-dependent methyltransferase, partial [Bdellovibrionia bacterium]